MSNSTRRNWVLAAAVLTLIGTITITRNHVSADELNPNLSVDLDQVPDDQLRSWLGNQLAALVAQPQRKQEVWRQVQGLTPQQLRLLAQQYRQQLALAQAQLAQDQLLQAQRLRDQLLQQQQFQQQGQNRQVVGFQPVITTLPEGAQLNASALISPDGRSVRIQAVPFFSYIPEVQTFNFYTGQVRRLPGYEQHRPTRPPQVWYDGLRTRYGRPPGG